MTVAKSILLHTCCAPCLIAPYYKLKGEGYEISSFWYNINIHPYTEYRQRRETLEAFALQEGFELILRDEYGLQQFVKAVADNIPGRCSFCYETRLDATAKLAAERGFDAFSTTLLYSRYQKHELIRQIAEKCGEKYGVAFYYEDFRPLWDEGIRLSKEAGMYRQKYCGCIFSEEERYLKKKDKR